MHPITAHEAAKARIADWHQQAERDRMARAARLARKPHRRRFMPGDLATGFARRTRAVLAAHSPQPPTGASARTSTESHNLTSPARHGGLVPATTRTRRAP